MLERDTMTELRRMLAAGSPSRRKKDCFEPIELNLRPEHRARYEEVRAWRRENNDCLVGEGTES
jgi:hypothetical protein